MASADISTGGRDRLLTALRGISMGLVVVVHVGFAEVGPTGLRSLAPNLPIDLMSWALVWVIGSFFVASGAVLKRSGQMPLLAFWRKRGLRLLVPYYVFAVLVLPVQFLILEPLGVCPNLSDHTLAKALTWIFPLHVDCNGIAQGPFWFLMVFIPICLAIPLLVRIYDSWCRWWFPVVSLAVLVILDLLLVTGATPNPNSAFVDRLASSAGGFSPFALLFLSFHIYLFWTVVLYAGFFYADGYPARLGRKLLPIGVGLLAVLAILVIWGPYNENSFGYSWPGSYGNQFPPTITWMVGTFGWLAIFIYFRDWIERQSLRPRIAPAVDWLASKSLTILIWHLMVLEFAVLALVALGFFTTIEGWPLLAQQLFWEVVVWVLLVPVATGMNRIEGRVVDFIDTRVLPRRDPA